MNNNNNDDHGLSHESATDSSTSSLTAMFDDQTEQPQAVSVPQTNTAAVDHDRAPRVLFARLSLKMGHIRSNLLASSTLLSESAVLTWEDGRVCQALDKEMSAWHNVLDKVDELLDAASNGKPLASQTGSPAADSHNDPVIRRLNRGHQPLLDRITELEKDNQRLKRLASQHEQRAFYLELQIKSINSRQAKLPGYAAKLPDSSATAPPPAAAEHKELLTVLNRLIIVMTGDKAMKYPLQKSIVTIGRGAENDIQVTSRHISRVHARIISESDQVIIEDMGSTNGVRINETAVKRHPLRNGDLIVLGQSQFKFIDLMDESGWEGNA